jgi:hypothetical protein
MVAMMRRMIIGFFFPLIPANAGTQFCPA